jgi:hypothetical protein
VLWGEGETEAERDGATTIVAGEKPWKSVFVARPSDAGGKLADRRGRSGGGFFFR